MGKINHTVNMCICKILTVHEKIFKQLALFVIDTALKYNKITRRPALKLPSQQTPECYVKSGNI